MRSIPLHQAQDRLAQQHGFSNLALLTKHTPTREAIKSQLAGQPDSRVRYYFHGDQKEDNANLYYCAQCDFSFTLDHFATEHGPKTIERYIRELETADSLPASWHRRYRRPTNAVNALDDEVRKFRAEAALREASRSAFHRWIVKQVGRRDWVGDLAQDIKGDKDFPIGETSLDELVAYLKSERAVDEALTALKQAYAEFSALG
ncbi:YozE family protein [Burkholderia ambifaria]|uniref:YozE family protein n=1 Tax=Burkholderia ambifaria TaxID=152480 RepID=UPI0009DB0F53|nr:YozE family protein [Burkholderia ambifaria]